MPMNSANLILVCTWLSLAVAVIANPNAHAGRSLGHHAHPELVALSHLPPIVAKVDDSTGQIETVGLQKKKRAFGGKNAKRYYGDERGFTRPSALPTKRGTVLPAGWSSVGCVTEGQSARALQGLSYTSSTMTVNTCLEVCRGQGFNLAGLEWSDECYCGNSFAAGGGTTESSSSCNMACTGGSDETCGGYFVLSAYSYSAANATAVAECSAAVAGSSIIATATSLVSASASSSALPFGASSAVPSGFSASASASASGSASVNGSSVSASSFVASSTVSSSAAVPTASSTTSTEWEAIGCYVDNPNTNNGKNILQGTKLTGSSTMTQESCQTRCAGQGYNFAGLEYGDECWCGDLSTSDLSSLVSNSPWCNMPCTGNSAETCGGGWSLQLFEQVDVTDSSC